MLQHLAGPVFAKLTRHLDLTGPLGDDFNSAQEFRQRYLIAAALVGKQ